MNKIKLKRELEKMGIPVTASNKVKKSDIKKALSDSVYTGNYSFDRGELPEDIGDWVYEISRHSWSVEDDGKGDFEFGYEIGRKGEKLFVVSIDDDYGLTYWIDDEHHAEFKEMLEKAGIKG